MSIIRPWAIWRRIQYGAGFMLLWVLVGVAVYYSNYYQPPTCFDGRANGSERGVDCGGECVRICAADVLPPRVVWAESFEINDGQYNAVAYVENQNQIAAMPELKYTFEFLSNGVVVGEQSGVTVLPPNSIYPIFEGRVAIDGGTTITETRLVFGDSDLWVPASVGRDQFRTVDIALSNTDGKKPRLDVQIENTALTPADAVEVVATIFNDQGQPVTASQTFIEWIESRSKRDIVFTWPHTIARSVRSCDVPTDVAMAIDLSGSMNNDGGEPPQPVTSALEAAGQFIANLRSEDQAAVITFATDALTTTSLGHDHTATKAQVEGLTIDPAEESGFTNTVAALRAAQQELNSARHNTDARRVLVLLTDGLATAPGETDVVAEAAQVATMLDKDAIEIYAIGLGQEVDQTFINTIASQPANAYLAPSAADLSAIYTEITSSLCEVGPTKIDVIAKTKTNFAPLR